jgi:hypothetical protein
MLDDLRNPGPTPSEEERAWMETSPLVVVMQAFALAAIAIAIGVSVSHLLVSEAAVPAATFVASP